MNIEPTRDDDVMDSKFNVFVQTWPKVDKLKLQDILGSRDLDEYLQSLLTSMAEAGFTLEEAKQSLLDSYEDLDEADIDRNWRDSHVRFD